MQSYILPGKIIGTQPSSITRNYHRKPYIYETLPEKLSARIKEKAYLLARHENYFIRELLKHIRFSLKHLNGEHVK
jgi:hypothetical protein